MIAKTITYTDYNGMERTETFLFHLSKAELMEMEFGTVGGFIESVQKIIEANNIPKIAAVWKDLLLRSYGEKSDDGRRLVKSPELSKAFTETPAYEILYMELAQSAEKSAEFIKGIIPKDMIEEHAEEIDAAIQEQISNMTPIAQA